RDGIRPPGARRDRLHVGARPAPLPQARPARPGELRRRLLPPATARRPAPPARRSGRERHLTGSPPVHRGKRTALVSMTATVVVVAAISGAAQSAGANRLDGTLRTNQVQVLATHNSYHIQQDAPIQSSPTTQYTHAPLDQQLDLGVRGFEIDVVNAPDGSFPVVHTPVVDASSNCTPLAQRLQG